MFMLNILNEKLILSFFCTLSFLRCKNCVFSEAIILTDFSKLFQDIQFVPTNERNAPLPQTVEKKVEGRNRFDFQKEVSLSRAKFVFVKYSLFCCFSSYWN